MSNTIRLSPIDTAFISALTMLVTNPYPDSSERKLAVDCASEAYARGLSALPQLEPVAAEFAYYRAATRGTDIARAEFDLRARLSDFHRWRLGRAQAAMNAA